MIDGSLRERITAAVSGVLMPLPEVLAGWEGGSAAFGALDAYSDLDLNYLVDDAASFEALYVSAEEALQRVSPVTASHPVPPGRYYQLKHSGEFLLIDLCFLRAGAPDHQLDFERHGRIVPLFDKGDWLRPRRLEEAALAARRNARYRGLETWFPISQSFVRKAILRGQQVEALSAFWGYTLRPLADLLRMQYCPARWDFGMRYLDRDLPPDVYERVRQLTFVPDLAHLATRLADATAWGLELLRELKPRQGAHSTHRDVLVPRHHLLIEVANRIATVQQPHPVRVAIDGVDAAGKTTFADDLAQVLTGISPRPVIRASIDDFHRPRLERHKRGRLSAEGYYRDTFNIPAVKRELLDPLGPDGNRIYRRRVFDLQTELPVDIQQERAPNDAILLFDGVFLLQPELRPFWDFSIFLEVSFATSVKRAETRDIGRLGSVEQVRLLYEHRYVPGQQLYLAEANPRTYADVVVDNEDVEARTIE